MSPTGLPYDDPRWSELEGGYRVKYDPRPALQLLERNERIEDVWKELWNELHHQGDVGGASYAAVPHLVRIHDTRGVPDWNTYGLVATIEEGRRAGWNPELSAFLRSPYLAAMQHLYRIGLRELADAEDDGLISQILSVVAMAKGQFHLGRFAANFNEQERAAIIETGEF